MTAPAATPAYVTLHFDPSCPFTWRTSRWLVDVTARAGVELRYRPFEISAGSALDEVDERWRERVAQGRRFLRGVEAAGRDGRYDVVAAAYAAYGKHVHEAGEDPTAALVEQVWTDAGGERYVAALDDVGLDAAVLEARHRGTELAGDEIGSPVTVIGSTDGSERGFFGPVVWPFPTGENADRLWTAVVSAAAVPEFFELKTRRTAP